LRNIFAFSAVEKKVKGEREKGKVESGK